MEKWFKRGRGILLALILVLGLVACGGGAEVDGSADPPEPPSLPTPSEPLPPAPTESPDLSAPPEAPGSDRTSGTDPVVSEGHWVGAAIQADGSLWAWGSNHWGFFGDDTAGYRPAPVQLGTDTDWASVLVGNLDIFTIKTDGTLWVWWSDAGEYWVQELEELSGLTPHP